MLGKHVRIAGEGTSDSTSSWSQPSPFFNTDGPTDAHRRVKCDGVRPCCGTCKVYRVSRFHYGSWHFATHQLTLHLRLTGRMLLGSSRGSPKTSIPPTSASSRDPGGRSRKAAERQRPRPFACSWALEDEGGGTCGWPRCDKRRRWYFDQLVGSQRVVTRPSSESVRCLYRVQREDRLKHHITQVEGKSGDYQVYGPTSAFRHLGKYNHDSAESSSPLNRGFSPESTSSLPDGFRRYLPQEIYLTQEQHDNAVDRFFRYYASWGELRSHLLG
jgi:hypothetical protein